MSFQLLSRRNVFGRLFGAAAMLFGVGGSAAAAWAAEPAGTAPLDGITYYTYDDLGRLVSIDESPPPCDASRATQPAPSQVGPIDGMLRC